MEPFHRVEGNILHNRAQPFRAVGDAIWKRVAAALSNRDAAKFTCACRYFAAIARLRAPHVGINADEERALRFIAPLATLAPVRDALRAFAKCLVLCAHCKKYAHTAMFALPECHHPVCDACWSVEFTGYETRSNATTTQEHCWDSIFLACKACGAWNEMDDGAWTYVDWETCMHRLEGRELKRLAPLSVHVNLPAKQATTAENAEAAEAAAAQVRAMADRVRRLHRYLFDRYNNKPAFEAVKRELDASVAWLTRLSSRPPTLSGGGRFAWN